VETISPLSLVKRRFRFGCFVVQGINGLASCYYFNYLFFYLKDHFGFGAKNNLLITALYGFMYMICAYRAGGFAQRRGYFFALTVGVAGLAVAMTLGGLAPHMLGYTHNTVVAEVFIVIFWTSALCLTWPTLQALLSEGQSPKELSRTAGIYNMVWSGTSALAYLTSGALLDHFGGEILFWFPAALHLSQLFYLPFLKKMHAEIQEREAFLAAKNELPSVPREKNPQAAGFLKLALVANPFAYVAIYGLIPAIPKVADHFGLTATMAGFVCSLWQWARLVAFGWFSVWAAWHYRFRWLLSAFLAAMISFVAILLCSQLWVLIGAQIVFGLAVGLIYYSSLFYSMDSGASKGKRGGIHEAAIGLGICLGPGMGVAALQVFPGSLQAATAGMGGLLLLGLMLFLWLRRRQTEVP
jgi:predicted MFS family arabinose efflux permease